MPRISKLIPNMHRHQRVRYRNRRYHQIMFILIPCRNNRIHYLRIRIQKLICISFVLNIKLFYPLFSLIPDKNIQQDKMREIGDLLIYRLRFVTYLNVLIFKQGVFLTKIADFEASGSLFLANGEKGLG